MAVRKTMESRSYPVELAVMHAQLSEVLDYNSAVKLRMRNKEIYIKLWQISKDLYSLFHFDQTSFHILTLYNDKIIRFLKDIYTTITGTYCHFKRPYIWLVKPSVYQPTEWRSHRFVGYVRINFLFFLRINSYQVTGFKDIGVESLCNRLIVIAYRSIISVESKRESKN